MHTRNPARSNIAITTTTALLLLLASTAAAALEVVRDVTVTDDAGGTLVMATVGSRDALGADSTTTATFSDFRPELQGRIVDGSVMRSRSRSAETVETVYDGELAITTTADGTGPDRIDTLVFESLKVSRDGSGPEISGIVIYNDETVDAADLPRRTLRLLARTLRFFAFA